MMAFSDRELLARIIQCEAGGEGENGMKAVASVVMNRVHITYGEYGRLQKNIRSIIYQRGQFDCVRETVGGRTNTQTIYNMRPTQVHYDIADCRQQAYQSRLCFVVFQSLQPSVQAVLSFGGRGICDKDRGSLLL